MKYILIVWHQAFGREMVFPHIQKHYDSAEDVAIAAEYWLAENPNDIVMFDVIETDICKHCGRRIQEVPGWMLHKWAHFGSITRICFTPALTQAEPKEAVA